MNRLRSTARHHRWAVLLAGFSISFILSLQSCRRSLNPPESRPLEPRLSGTAAWAPFRRPLKKKATVSTVRASLLDEVRGPLPKTRAAAAELLVDHPRAALATLTSLSESANTQAVWNDLSVALFENAARYDAPELFADGLAACDRALALDPVAREPLFNRALILERLGLRDDARAAWNRYLLKEGSSEWGVEAREHLRGLEPDVPFIQLLDRLPKNSPAERIQALAARDPQNARAYGAMEVLARWGEAFARRRGEADRHLAIARVLGEEVVRVNDDRFLQRAVASIDASTEERRAILAAAHVDYRAGMYTYRSSRPSEAEPLLRRAADEFERGGSPMALAARYFAANTIFEQGHKDQAQRQLEPLLQQVPAEYPSLRAQITWEIGVCHASHGDWGESIRLLDESASKFDQLHEPDYAGAVRRLISFVYDRIGDSRTAWQVRMLSLRDIGRRSDRPLEKAVGTIADAAILEGKWRTAESFLTLQADIARRIGHATHLTDALITRAVVRNRLGDDAGANADRIAAEAAFARVQDPAYQDLYRAARLRLRAVLSRSPSEAAALLTETIEYQASHSDVLNLPPLLMERGRARKKMGDLAGAAADFEQGIADLEKHRESLPAGEARWGAFHAAEDLFDEAMALAIDRGDVSQAFALAERKRARTLLESYGTVAVFDARKLPRDVTVVEFASLPGRLVTFVVDATSGVRAVTTSCSRERLKGASSALVSALRDNDTGAMRRESAAMYELLIRPIASQLVTVTVAFVPDATTAIVPFSALSDEHGDYLIERYAVVVTPSVAVYAASAERDQQLGVRRTVLILPSSGADGNAGKLAFVSDEASGVARSYARAIRLDEASSQFDDLSKDCPKADVIHFAGHAIGDDSSLEPASILVRQYGQERRIGVAEIAQLHLRPRSVVVLGGCNTARGESRASEGVVSVAHGFLTAGARSVIATLWRIDDEMAASFFPRLHQRLAIGASPSEALRAVQLEAIREGAIPPSFWAALQDYGT